MDSSDDEEGVPQYVEEYYFVGENDSPVSFSELPIRLGDSEYNNAGQRQVFLHGTVDKGLEKIFKQVVAWKLQLESNQPEVSVLSKENKWIKLVKPRKSYENVIRSVMITIQMLHFLKNEPDASDKSLWDYLKKTFITLETLPSDDDLKDNLWLIKLFHENDATLEKSKLIPHYLLGKPSGKMSLSEAAKKDVDRMQSFIVHDDEVDDEVANEDGEDSDEDADLFDSVCAICDNGGELLCCEGRCMRSFHATEEEGLDSDCKSLGLTKAKVEEMQNFLCHNCLYKKHQCFGCGKLGSSDKSSGTEVFQCLNATCGHFYHPKCVAELVFPGSETQASELANKIAAGETFTCPVHRCVVCKQGENKEVLELQFAVCRRCPKSYHRKCLPRKIAFRDIEEEGIIQRAWEKLLPNRILIYCLKHEIDEDFGTPIRNHIIFPEDPEKKAKILLKNNAKVLVKKKGRMSDVKPGDQPSLKPYKVIVKHPTRGDSTLLGKRARDTASNSVESLKKVKPKQEKSDLQKSGEHPIKEVSKIMKKEKPQPPFPIVSSTSNQEDVSEFKSSFPTIDSEIMKRVSSLKEQISSQIKLEDIIRKHTVPSTHSYSARHIDRSIQLGKVEGSVEAIRTALQKLDEGGTVDDAKAVCEPEVVKQINRWGNKLKVYLAPFLHGMRYTSFGRHFTKVDKLKEIAERMQRYVQNGDMIVDFCCGANDFSQIMTEKLDAAGKKCSFKNYDVIRPKNTLCFERRDWMKVQPRELPTGSQLIMGLNPPFGVKAALANKFIDKALTFKPKLLILIVPPETERLDKKIPSYDLIWEDPQFLSGKSFYLPGSVDVNDKQMEQWNLKPPVLYLWSRPDWTTKHRSIAMKYGHISNERSYHFETDREIFGDAVPRQAQEEREGGREGSKDIGQRPKRKMPDDNERKGDKDEDSADLGNVKPKENDKVRIKKRKKPQKKRALDVKVQESSPQATSDMDISPLHENHFEDQRQSEPLDMPADRGVNRESRTAYAKFKNKYENHHQSEPLVKPNNPEPRPDYGKDFVGNTISHDEIDEVARRYTAASATTLNGWSTGEQFPSYRESSADSYSRRSYLNGCDGYGTQPSSYGLQGQNDFLHRNMFSLRGEIPPVNVHAPSGYGLSGPAAMGASATQRYAPRLDETNNLRSEPFGSGGVMSGVSSGVFDVRGMHIAAHPTDSRGFVQGPQYGYPHQGSSGWLDD